jgi:hypothetical protein
LQRSVTARQSFRDRLEGLRDAWHERREVRPLAAARDFGSQRALLGILHDWCIEAAALVREVYGEELEARVEPLQEDALEFSMVIGSAPPLVFGLLGREGSAGRGPWSVALRAADAPAPVGQRRNGPWSRARLEQLLLSTIAAHERGRSSVDVG